jgi:cysteinyl-tRNA synthetase
VPKSHKKITISAPAQDLLVARDQARLQKDFKEADRLRDELQGAGLYY